MRFNDFQKNAKIFFGFIIMMIGLDGCTQLTPHYLVAPPYEKSLILYREGSLREAREKIGEVKRGEPDYKAAQELLLKIDALTSRLVEKHRELAEEYEKASLYAVAAEEYRIALKLDPANISIRKKLEEASEKSPYFQEKESKSVNPEVLAREHYRKGVALLQLKQFNKAIDEFTIVLKVFPSYSDTEQLITLAKKERDEAVDIHLKRGIDYFKKEELELAIREWDLVFELDPFNKTATDYKARAEAIMEKMKDIKERGKQ